MPDAVHQLLATETALAKLGARNISADEAGQRRGGRRAASRADRRRAGPVTPRRSRRPPSRRRPSRGVACALATRWRAALLHDSSLRRAVHPDTRHEARSADRLPDLPPPVAGVEAGGVSSDL